VGDKKIQKMSLAGLNFLKIVSEVFEKCNAEEIQLFVGIARKIWLRRNDVVHGNSFTHPTILVLCARKNLADFLQATKHGTGNLFEKREVGPRSWAAPGAGRLKVNWDASLNRIAGLMGLGVVVRDENGLVVAAQSKTIRGNFDPPMAEARAALLAIQFCRMNGFMLVDFEGDVKTVIDAVNDVRSDWSRLGVLITDI
jgi:hypothetical protein